MRHTRHLHHPATNRAILLKVHSHDPNQFRFISRRSSTVPAAHFPHHRRMIASCAASLRPEINGDRAAETVSNWAVRFLHFDLFVLHDTYFTANDAAAWRSELHIQTHRHSMVATNVIVSEYPKSASEEVEKICGIPGRHIHYICTRLHLYMYLLSPRRAGGQKGARS